MPVPSDIGKALRDGVRPVVQIRCDRMVYDSGPEGTIRVVFDTGLSNDKKTMPVQRGADGGSKANPHAFGTLHYRRSCRVFADGHAEFHAASDLMVAGGGIKIPQTMIV